MSEYLCVGMRVVVPFGKSRLLTGIVTEIHEEAPTAYTARYIDSMLDEEPVIVEQQLLFFRWMADYYMCYPGEVLLAALPIGMRLSSETKYVLNPTFDGDLTQFLEREVQLLEVLGVRETMNGDEISGVLGIKGIQATVKKLLEASAILVFEDLKERYKPKMASFIKLSEICEDEAGLQNAFELTDRAQKQQEALLSFVKASGRYTEETVEIRKTNFQKEYSISASIIAQLVKKGIFELFEREIGRLPKSAHIEPEDLKLSELQAKAFAKITHLFSEKDVTLLHGVTSSGKTEIYIELIKEQLEHGKQVLYMLPEIALTTQMIERLRRFFGKQVMVYHSRFNQNERVEVWNMVLQNDGDNGSLILGARSSIFLPYQNLGMIIVDEEHENSFKQHEPAPRYHARDAAVVLASIHQAKVLLGSATPSYESLYNARQGKYGLVELSHRYGGISPPVIRAASLSKKNAPTGYFTRELLEEAGKVLAAKEQIILFQNRRGYAPVLLCEMCGWSPECVRCDVSLTFHKEQKRLVCHYCGNRYNTPPTCAACGSHKLKLTGFGTERIEEEIAIQFPEARIARLDFDSTRTKYAYQQILSDFQEGDIDILIGTQMVTKGLDFGKVSLVGVLNADLLLKYPDFRATERGFQLMTQVAGRAGRRQKRGNVIIQTFDTSQWIIGEVVKGNFDSVARSELDERQKFLYPPFSRLIRFTFRHREVERVDLASAKYVESLKTFLPESAVLGPEYPAVARVKNQYNKNVIIKISPDQSVKKIKEMVTNLNNRFFQDHTFKAVRLIINVDPQ